MELTETSEDIWGRIEECDLHQKRIESTDEKSVNWNE